MLEGGYRQIAMLTGFCVREVLLVQVSCAEMLGIMLLRCYKHMVAVLEVLEGL